MKDEVWWVKKEDGEVFGPVTLDELRSWAIEGRVVHGDLVSRDRETWESADGMGELGMKWVVVFPGGDQVGPMHIGAVAELMIEGSVQAEDSVRDISSGRMGPASKVVLRGLLDEVHSLEGRISEERSAWETLLENERRAAERQGAHYRRLLEEARRRQDALAQDLSRIEKAIGISKKRGGDEGQKSGS